MTPNTEISCEGRPSVSHADLVSFISLFDGAASPHAKDLLLRMPSPFLAGRRLDSTSTGQSTGCASVSWHVSMDVNNGRLFWGSGEPSTPAGQGWRLARRLALSMQAP